MVRVTATESCRPLISFHTVARAVSTSPDGLLAAPSEYPFNNSRHRSTSLAPSFRSTKSNVTIVEDKENRTSVAKTQVLRQQTFKIQRKFDLMDRIKALWDPKGLIRKMETSIECVPPNALDEDVCAHVLFPFAAKGRLDAQPNRITLHCRRPCLS